MMKKTFFFMLYFIVFAFPFLKGAYGDDYNYLLHFSVLVLLMIYVLYLFSGGNARRQTISFYVPWIVFLLSCFVSLHYSMSQRESFKDFMLLLDYFFIFYLLCAIPVNEEDIKKLFLTQSAASVLLSVYAIYQILSSFPDISVNPLAKALMIGAPQRAFSTFIHPNIFGSYSVMSSFLILGCYKTCKDVVLRFLFTIALVLNSLALFFTFSFGVGAVYLIVLSLYIAFSYEKRKDALHLFLIGMTAVLCAVILVQRTKGTVHDISRDVVLLTNKETKKASFSGRLSLWKTCLYTGISSPLYGSGLRTFKSAGMRYQRDAMYSMYPHNVYAQMFCETGFFGLFAFLWLVLYLLIKGCRILFSLPRSPGRSLYVCMFLSLLFFVLHNAIDFDWNIPYLPFLFFVFSGLLFSASGQVCDDAYSHVETARVNFRKIPMTAVVLCFLVYLSWSAAMRFYAYHHLQSAYFLLLRRDFHQASAVLSGTQTLLENEPAFHSAYARVYEGTGDMKNALIHAEKGYQLEPLQASYAGQPAYLYFKAGRIKEAKSKLLQALTLCPFCVDYIYGLSQIALMEGNPKEAKKMLEKGIRLFPFYDRIGKVSHTFYKIFLMEGDLLRREGNTAAAKMVYEKAQKLFPKLQR